MRTAVRVTLLLLASAIATSAPGAAHAQEATAEMLEAEARARFDLAMVHVQNGRFEDAAAEFQTAYELSHRDELLYNLYLAWRDAGQPGAAADALSAYLETRPPDDAARPNLESRLRSLRAQAEASSAPPAEVSEVAPASSEQSDGAEPQLVAPAPPRRTQPSPIGWAVLAVGGAAAVTASVTGILAIEFSDTLARECASGVCPAARRVDAELGATLALSTDVLWPLSIGLIGVGALLVLLVEDEIPPEQSLRLGGGCGVSGCQASLTGSFR